MTARILSVPTPSLQGGQGAIWGLLGAEWLLCSLQVTHPGRVWAPVLWGRELGLALPLALSLAVTTASQFKWELGWL